MYTLQILDAGQTFLHTLGEQTISLGTDKGAHVRLRESGVAPIHAWLEPHSQGIRIKAGPDAEVLVNGSPVQDAQLRLGDRIELGRVVMIVGRTVSRAASVEDVLASAVARTPRSPRKISASGKLVPILAAVAVLVGVIFMATQGDDSSYVRGRLGDVENARASGDLERAREEVASLRREWLGAEDDRLHKVDEAEAAIAATEATHAALLAQVVDPAGTRNYAEWSRELQRLEASGSADQKVAARKVRSRLREKLRERDAAVEQLAIAANANGGDSSADSATAEQNSQVASSGARVGDSDTGSDSVVGQAASNSEPVAADEIERLCGGGLYAQALGLLQAAFDQAANPEAVAGLQVLEQTVRLRAAAAMDQLLTEAHSSEQQGRLQHAVTLLQVGRHNFPSGAGFAKLGDELQRLEVQIQQAEQAALLAAQPAAAKSTAAPGKVDEATRLQTLESLRTHMAAVRTAQDKGDFTETATLLRQAAEAVRSRDAEFAGRLLTQAEEAAQLAGWNESVVAAVQSGKELVVTDRRGQQLQFLRVDGRRIMARGVNGDAPLDWYDVDAASMQDLGKQLKASGSALLGLAAMLYKNGDDKAAEGVLASVLRADAALQPEVDQLLARCRGEAGHGHSYVLRKGEFVSLRSLEVEKVSKKLVAKLDAAMRQKDLEARNRFVAETQAASELDAEALRYAMQNQFAKLETRVEASAVRKQVNKMVVERDRLDAARKHAKDLIFDSVKYFYPYKPPAVSSDKFAEYNRVQADVAERVAALRDIWDKSTVKLNIPKPLGVDLEQLDWLAMQMSRLGYLPEGESVASVLAPLAWARALPPGEVATVRSFCLTPEERQQQEDWRRIDAYNDAVAGEFSVAQRTLLKITNDYRVMFGHRPLAMVKSACDGSQGHADEMSRLGYFSHMSPIAKRRTPSDRMRLAGYAFGVSENIAMTGGALASHNAWCTSSGHHRNLLTASHREIGIGANGRYWVQNFGSGEVHKTHPVWATLASK